jgi:hypothetical protein
MPRSTRPDRQERRIHRVEHPKISAIEIEKADR